MLVMVTLPSVASPLSTRVPSPRFTDRVGASATPVTATFRVEVVLAVEPSDSAEVAVTVRVKSSLELVGGATVSPARSAGSTVQVSLSAS